MKRIDLNCDMGEIPAAIADGTQEALMPFLSSVNIACGGHAGDESTIRETIAQAMRHGLAIGAHPGYPDRENFGRIELEMALDEVSDFVYEQVRFFAGIAADCGATVRHVKPHGALYNQAVRSRALAQAIAEGVARWSRGVVLMGLAGSPMIEVFQSAGFPTAAEAFADRRYEADGTLRNRRFADALIRDPKEAGEQVLRLVQGGTAQTICIHGDTPGAKEIAEEVARALRAAGVEIGAN